MKNKVLGLIFSAGLLTVGGIFADATGEPKKEKVVIGGNLVSDAQTQAAKIREKAQQEADEIVQTAKGAEDTSDEKVAKAEKEARAVVAKAQKEADEVVAKAQTKFDKLNADSVAGKLRRAYFSSTSFVGGKYAQVRDFTSSHWENNTYYIRPVTWTALTAAAVSVVYKVWEKVNQADEEEVMDAQ